MAINKEDSGKINYKPDVEWHIDRMYAIAAGSEDQSERYKPSEVKIDAKELLKKFEDLKKKATKLDDAIDTLSAAEKIPIDTVRQPKVSFAVKNLDAASNGEYISYELYKGLSLQMEEGSKALSLDWLIENQTNDVQANSDLIYYRYGAAAGATTESSVDFSKKKESPWSEIGSEILDGVSEWASQDFFIKQVMDFSNTFLAKTRDASYIPWNFKPDVRRKLAEYDNIGEFLTQYTDFVKDLSETTEGMPNSPLELARDFFDAFDGKADSDNNFFGKINDVLGFNYTADLVCCFSGWAHGLDLKTLQALRMILSIVANGVSLDFGSLMNTLVNIINNLFRDVIGAPILGLIDKVFQLITNPIRNWLNTDDEKWRKIFLCTPIDELVNTFVLGGIAYLEQMLIEKVMDYLKLLEIDVHFEECKVTLMEKTKKLDALIQLLDMIIGIVSRLSYCGLENSPLRDRVSRTLDNLEISPNWNYTYPPEEEPNEYNSFVKHITTVETITDPETGAEEVVERIETSFVEEITTNKIAVSKEQIDACLKRVAEEDVFSVQEWMEDIRANAKDEDVLDQATEELNV